MPSVIGTGQKSLTDMNDLVASTTPPSSPIEGTLWLNTTENKLYIYTSGQWVFSADGLDVGGRNFVLNSNFATTTTNASIGWDNALNGTTFATNWSSGYNSGVTAPTTGYHAHINTTKFGYPVLEFIDKNSTIGQTHRWLGMTQAFDSTKALFKNLTVGKKYTISMDVMSDTLGMYVNTGLYHFQTGNGTQSFFGQQWNLDACQTVNIWERKTKTFTVESQWDLTKSFSLYLYGNNSSVEGQMWVKNVKIEEGDIYTGWVSAPEDTQTQIDNITITLGNMTNDSVIDYLERQYVKDRLTEILGFVQPDATTTLPTSATLDAGSSGKGTYYNARQSALNAGITTSDTGIAYGSTTYATVYGNLATQYTNLKTYLEGLTPIDVWDVSTTNQAQNVSVTKATWRTNWQNYYQAEADLQQAIAKKLKDMTNTGSGRNYIRNTALLNDSSFFSLATGVTRDTTFKNGTLNTFKYVVTGLGADSWRSANPTPYTPCKAGDVVSASAEVYIPTGHGIDIGTPTLEIQFFDVNGTRLSTATTASTLSTLDAWQVLKRENVTVPANATQMNARVWLQRNGSFWSSKYKLEFGVKATDWTPAIEDLEGRVTSVESFTTPTAIVNTVRSDSKYLQDINIKIGGKNLIQNSSFNSYDDKTGDIYNWTDNVNYVLSDTPDADKPNSNYININRTGLASDSIQFMWSDGVLINANGIEDFTISFDIKVASLASVDSTGYLFTIRTFADNISTATASYSLTLLKSDLVTAGLTDNTWFRYSVTFKPTSGAYIRVSPYLNRNGNVSWREIKLERGTRATDYTTAEADLTATLTTLVSQMSSVQQTLTADGINTLFTQTQSYTDITTGKADSGLLGNYATNDKVQGVEDGIPNAINDAIDALKLDTTYATKLDLDQTSKNVTAKFSASGGMNLLKNSIGYADFITSSQATAGTKGWFKAGTGNATRITRVRTSALDTLGFGSGFQFQPDGTNALSIDQYVTVVPNQVYTLSWYVSKTNNSVSLGAVDLFCYESDDTTKVKINSSIADSTDKTTSGSVVTSNTFRYADTVVTSGFEAGYIAITPTTNRIRVRGYTNGNASAVLTGLMLSIGDVPLQWSLATGEAYNTNVRLDINGIRVSQLNANKDEIGYTQISPTEFAGFYDADGDGNFEKVFYLNGDETVSKKVRALNEFTMGTIKISKVPSANDWQVTYPYLIGDKVSSGANTYICTVGGTSGTVAPTHTTGTATDGTVTWSFVSTSAYIGWAFIPTS